MAASDRPSGRRPRLLLPALALALALPPLLLGGCSGREHSNPFDPQNPGTGGVPGGVRATAGCGRVDLSWDELGLADIEGFRLWRERTGPQPGPATLLSETPLPAGTRTWSDLTPANDVPYAYVVEFLFAGGGAAPLRAVEARPGAALPWVADPCGYGLTRLAPDGGTVLGRVSDGLAVLDLEVDPVAHRLYAAAIDSGLVLEYATQGGARLRTFDAAGASALDWAPDLQVLAVGAFYEQRLAWFREGGQLLAAIAVDGHPEAVALRDSATTWVVLYEGDLLRAAWDSAGGARIARVDSSFVRPVRVVDDAAGPGCWIADRGAGRVLYRGDDGAMVGTAPGLLAEPVDLAPSPRGGCWVADRAAGAIVRLDRGCREVERRAGLGRVAAVAEDPANGVLWITVPDAGEVWRLDPDGRATRIVLDGCPRRLAIDPSGGCPASAF